MVSYVTIADIQVAINELQAALRSRKTPSSSHTSPDPLIEGSRKGSSRDSNEEDTPEGRQGLYATAEEPLAAGVSGSTVSEAEVELEANFIEAELEIQDKTQGRAEYANSIGRNNGAEEQDANGVEEYRDSQSPAEGHEEEDAAEVSIPQSAYEASATHQLRKRPASPYPSMLSTNQRCMYPYTSHWSSRTQKANISQGGNGPNCRVHSGSTT